jgi:hypothetical protein
MSATICRSVGIVLLLSVRASVHASLPAGAEDSIAGLALGDAESARALIGAFPPENPGYGFSHYRFANRNRMEVLTLVQHPGAEQFEISQVRVSAATAEESLPFFPERLQHFVTPRGISVGASKAEVKSLLGVPASEADDKLLYRLTKDTAASWLEMYHMPEYQAVYKFRDGRLVEFEFGFPYP